MRSLQAKILLAYLTLALLLVALSAVALYEIDRIADKAREGSRVAELFDVILELRRFEKNHFLYGQTSDLAEHARYLSRAKELLRRDAALIDQLAEGQTASGLGEDMERYGVAMAEHARRPADEARALGNRIVTLGEQLAIAERNSLNDALLAHQRNLMASVGMVAVLLVLTGFLLARRVTRPLQEMEVRMGAIVSGQLTRLAPDAPEQEFASLARAFNHVLDELERRQLTLVRAEKLASLGTLLSGVAHEINNPLSNISSSAQILKEGRGVDPGLQAQLVEDIDAETLRARRIVRTLLDYAGDRAFQSEQVPLAELVEQTLRFLKSKRPPGISVRLEIPGDLAVAGDRPRLQQLLLNLIINAYDAMGDYGELQFSASGVQVGSPGDRLAGRSGQCRPGGAAVDLIVSDSGPGIPEALLGRVFDPFFTTKAIGYGSGLGLYIAHEVIEEHGGCIQVDNQPQGGARFTLRLPAATADQTSTTLPENRDYQEPT
jgi:two-component system, NtrC family, sensor kinase